MPVPNLDNGVKKKKKKKEKRKKTIECPVIKILQCGQPALNRCTLLTIFVRREK
jgi:hypothetical protein